MLWKYVCSSCEAIYRLGQWCGDTGGVGNGVDGAEAALCLAQLLPPTTTVAPTTSAASRTSALEQDLEGGAEPPEKYNVLLVISSMLILYVIYL